jgi:hypothetical protein
MFACEHFKRTTSYIFVSIGFILFGLIVETGILLEGVPLQLIVFVNPGTLAFVLGVVLLLSVLNNVVLYDDSVLIHQNLFKRKEIRWSENPSVKFIHEVRWVTGKEETIPVNPSRRGFEEFLDYVIKKQQTHMAAVQAAAKANETTLDTPTTEPQDWLQIGTSIAPAALFLLFMSWSTYKSNPSSFGFYNLFWSILLGILGGVYSFSKKQREMSKKRALIAMPERAGLIESPDAEKRQLNVSHYTLATALILFLIWLWFYGFSSLAIGI